MITALINGQHTLIDEALLTPNHSETDTEDQNTKVTEWLLDGTVVHRSVHVTIKKGLGIEAALGFIG